MRARERWWTELFVIFVMYAAYSAGRLLARGDENTAIDNGLALLDIEKALYLNAETPLNRLFTAHTTIGVPADFVYASLHYLVTPLVLLWLWRRRREFYRRYRTWLMTSTMVGLIGFIFMPTCPPRLLDPGYGFVDTMAQYASYGWWGAEASAPRGLGGLTNQYAAMPSLHVGWALWCAVVLWRHARSTPVRLLAVAYPLVTTIVVMGTANHYFLDAVAGVAVMGIGLLLTRPVLRLADRVRQRLLSLRNAAGTAAGSGGGVPDSSEKSKDPATVPRIPVQNAAGREGDVPEDHPDDLAGRGAPTHDGAPPGAAQMAP